ncbi:MAG: hypothetical protein JNM99_07145 [Verrucomicrobiaceae bacterium]|nr:hypothetical protein [Verrucomicrobiaceae bacterium]
MLSRIILVAVLGFIASGCNKAPAKPYPLDTCPISGKKLNDHGEPYVFSRNGQEVKLCCEACLEEFDANADKLLKEIVDKSKP